MRSPKRAFSRVVGRLTWGAVFSLSMVSAGCRGCGSDASSTDSTKVDATSSSAPSSSVPFLPSRLAPDDSPEALSVVEQTLFGLRPQLNLCYREASKDNPKLEAQAIIGVTIDSEGRISDVAPISLTNVDDALLSCLRRQIRTVRFRKPPIEAGTSVTVKVPIVFKPRADAGGAHDAG